MVAFVSSCTLVGIDAVPVGVECSVSAGQLPSYHVVGLPAPSVKEGAVRIRSALQAIGHDMPLRKVTVNLAPADLRKPGSALDLPIASAMLVADGTYDGAVLQDLIILGELGLGGEVRGVRGVLAAAMLAKKRGCRGVLVPVESAAEALVVEGIEVYAVERLAELVDAMAGRTPLRVPEAVAAPRRRREVLVDMAEVRGQTGARFAVEVAVAGGHNLLLAGPPGTGKTMLARRIPTVLPPMSRAEALETTKIYSALGLAGGGLIEQRPFRAPHHTISSAALLGGGPQPRPGEISLAHNGVLFLDELPEFSRAAVEGLREPLEDRSVTIGRVQGTLRLPASFLLVAAANPCPCGWFGSGARECTCSDGSLDRYRARLSGPLLDRIDLQVIAEQIKLEDLRDPRPAEASDRMRERVLAARERQRARLARFHARTNAEMSSAVLRHTCKLDAAGERVLAELVVKKDLPSARSIDRLIRVARTLADLEERDDIRGDDLHAASRFRMTTDPAESIQPPRSPHDPLRDFHLQAAAPPRA